MADRDTSKNVMRDALTGPVKPHPYLSGVEFAHLAKEGGASMELSGFNIAQPNENAIFVGGERDKYDRTIAEQNRPAESFDAISVLKEHMRLNRRGGGSRGKYLGAWTKSGRTGDKVVIDKSGSYPNRDEAMDKMRERNQEAAWDMKNMDEISNPNFDPSKPKGVPSKRGGWRK